MGRIAALTALAATLILAGCPVSRPRSGSASHPVNYVPPKELTVKGPYIHEMSGMTFPETLNGYSRWPISQYDSPASSVSVGYNLFRLGSAIYATVYVSQAMAHDIKLFPIPRIEDPGETLMRIHFSKVMNAIEAEHPDAKRIFEDKVVVGANSKKETGLHAVYHYTQPTPYGDQLFQSEAYLFADDGWYVKCRVTYLECYKSICEKDAKAFVESISWPTIKAPLRAATPRDAETQVSNSDSPRP